MGFEQSCVTLAKRDLISLILIPLSLKWRCQFLPLSFVLNNYTELLLSSRTGLDHSVCV